MAVKTETKYRPVFKIEIDVSAFALQNPNIDQDAQNQKANNVRTLVVNMYYAIGKTGGPGYISAIVSRGMWFDIYATSSGENGMTHVLESVNKRYVIRASYEIVE